jgi:NADPH-dependent ferric siderophore reductase
MTVHVEHELPMILSEVEVVAVERLSPSYVRIELGGAALADLGVPGPLLDQRIKIVFPGADGVLPTFSAGPGWYADWLAQPEEQRGCMRTYTIRDVRGAGAGTRIVVDFVLHLAPGHAGPGSTWASAARPGDRVVITAPRRGFEYGGIEFAPGAARELLLVADETAVPAVGGILRDLGPVARGAAFLEVPQAGDILDLDTPAGMHVTWLPREGAPHGVRQIDAVRRHLGLPPVTDLVDDRLVDPDLWETPSYSSRGEELTDAAETVTTAGPPDLYAWIAGESKVVTTLRRCMVKELGLHRSQVAFMGYWREGVAMRS